MKIAPNKNLNFERTSHCDKNEKKGKLWNKFKRLLEKTKTALTIGAVSTALLCSAPAKSQENEAKNTQESAKVEHSILKDMSYGFNYYNNDAGSSLFGELNLTDWIGFTAGGIWLDQTPYAIASINLTPKLELWDGTVVLNYFGNVTGSHMASYLYTSHGAGVSAHFDIKDFRIDLATLGQFGISYPRYDLLFAKWMNGLALSYEINDDHRIGAYAINTNMWAASATPKTAFAMDYAPRYQGTEVGLTYNYRTHIFRVYTNIDVIEPYTGFEYGKSNLIENDYIIINAGVEGGVRGYNTPFFSANFYVYGWAEVRFKSTGQRKKQNNFSMKFEKENKEETFFDYTKELSYDSGQYTPEQLELMKKTNKTILASSTFKEFANSYRDAQIEELLGVANYMGSLLRKTNKGTPSVFSSEARELAGKNYEDVFHFLRTYIEYYTIDSGAEMPEELKRPIAICGGIHEFIAEFLRANGISAYAITVMIKTTPHIVTLAFYDGKSSIIDYGTRYTTTSQSLDEILKVYSNYNGVTILQSQVFGKDGKYIGTYTTPAGRLIQTTIKINGRTLLDAMLKQNPKDASE